MATFVHSTKIPIDGARTLPGRYFTSPEIFAAERDAIFTRRWLCIGRAAEIPAAGDYVLRQVGPVPLIVLRDERGVVRAFHNTCRHRGTRLCEAASGNVGSRITCPYHAWVYALDGRLLGAPSTSDIAGFTKADYPLRRAAVAEWEGFVFLNLAEEPEPFADAFAPLLGRFTRFHLARLAAGRRIEYDVQSNWKLLFQNYSECYHCAPVHPALVQLSPATSGENDLVDGPFLGGFMTLNAQAGSMTMSGRACGVPVGDLAPEDHARVYYYSIFPNMLLSLHPDYVMFHTLWPVDPARTRITCEWLFHPATLAGDFDIDDGVAFWDMTNRQDWHICEQSQLGVASPAYTPGPYSPRESLSVAFDRELLRALGRDPPAGVGGTG
jgi:glycine betaine catabolism A